MEIKTYIMKTQNLILKHNDLINMKYIRSRSIEFSFDEDNIPNELSLFIRTHYKRLPKKNYLEKIRRIFKADNVDFIDIRVEGEEPKPFWSINWLIK